MSFVMIFCNFVSEFVKLQWNETLVVELISQISRDAIGRIKARNARRNSRFHPPKPPSPLGYTYMKFLRACLHGGGGPQVGEVICLGTVKNNPPLHVIAQPANPGCIF